MIQSYDFLVHARLYPDVQEAIMEHIQNSEDSEMTYHSALLKFDSKQQKIIELPLKGAQFACKIVPMEMSYDTFYRLMESDEPWLIAEKECKFLK